MRRHILTIFINQYNVLNLSLFLIFFHKDALYITYCTIQKIDENNNPTIKIPTVNEPESMKDLT